MKIKTAMAFSLTAWVLGLLLWEWRRPLRRECQNKSVRVARNLSIAIISGIFLQLIEAPLVTWLCQRVQNGKLGLLNIVPLPKWFSAVASILLLDYTLYIWHVLNHKIPLLWRFHLVHHIDLDLDQSTALRFHFGEMLISILWRMMQIRVFGVDRFSLACWQIYLMFCVLFHHANVRLPLAFESALNRFIVTPRMHGLHHSVVQSETDSNWSSGLTIWDKIHGTFVPFDPPRQVTIGVPAYRNNTETRLLKMLSLPFGTQRNAWLQTSRSL